MRVLKLAMVAGVILALSGGAYAVSNTFKREANPYQNYTFVYDMSAQYEVNHEQILEGIYGGDFTKTNLDYSDGTITATRIQDINGNSPINLCTGGSGDMDQVWDDGTAGTVAKARYAGDNQSFGYWLNGGAYTKAFDVTGSGFSVSESAVITFDADDTWHWGRYGKNAPAGPHSSLESENPETTDIDHMVTYKITGLDQLSEDDPDYTTYPTWLLFFEDRDAGDGQWDDFDYNDLVVEVQCVPEPLTVLGVFLGVSGLGAYIRRRRRE